jgi:NAD(P)-dependent dehydrogenase (short-subunit alcohol dehydrogenase family)
MQQDQPQLLGGRVAVVTGAGQGNGKQIALGLAAAGAQIVVTDINSELAAATTNEIEANGGTAWAETWDVTNFAEAKLLAKKVVQMAGDVSILVNNAGIHMRSKIDAPEHLEIWRRIMAVNVDGILYGITAFLEQLKRTRGTIINIGSNQSFVAAPNDTAAYTTSKGAVLQMTKALAVELAPFGIRVNGIAPGFIETPQTEASRANKERMSFILGHTPLKRIGQPQELAGPVVFLASNMASFVTGAMLPVDGGFLAL